MITEMYTERLHLRTMTTADSPGLFEIWSDLDVTRFMNIDNFTDEEQAKEMIIHLEKLAQENKAIRFTVVELESDKIIGSCGYNFLDFDNSKTEIGYDLAKTHWGKGYATEAVSALINFAFNSLMINRVEAKVEPENIGSIKVLQKLNFTYEGTMRQCEKSKGKFIDLNIYSKLKTD